MVALAAAAAAAVVVAVAAVAVVVNEILEANVVLSTFSIYTATKHPYSTYIHS